ncbi:YIF1 family protein [Cryptosporidium felis]|nr:YIF1 family protein [Cryptosporidium felis]
MNNFGQNISHSNGVRKVNTAVNQQKFTYMNEKPLNNPFGAHSNVSATPENKYYSNKPSNFGQNTNWGQKVDFYNWEGSSGVGPGDKVSSINVSSFSNSNSFNGYMGNQEYSIYSDKPAPNTSIEGFGFQAGTSVSTAPENNFLNFGNNTSQLVMGIVSNTVKETTGLNSERISQLQLWFPQTIASLRLHFAVSHEYVLRKILLILCPYITFFTQNNGKTLSYESQTSISSIERDGGSIPTLFSDLYIPLMGFITYVLADGVINGVFSQFNPQILGSTATFSMVLLITEIIIFQLVAYIFSARVLSTLDLASALGYKYTSIVLCDFVLLSTGGVKTRLFWGLFIYFSISSSFLVYMMLKVISTQGLENQFSIIQQSGLTIVIIIFSSVQVPLCWILLPSI